jgi:chromosome segregation ATPase
MRESIKLNKKDSLLSKDISNNINNNNININKTIFTFNNSNHEANNNEKKSKSNNNNIIKKVEMININNEEIELFNKHIKIITENRNYQIKMNEMQKEITIKNETISQLESKLQEYLKNKEDFSENINKIKKEKEELSKLLEEEMEKFQKLKEYADEQQKKHIKYKGKFEEYKKKAKILKEEVNKKNVMKESFIYRAGSSAANDNKNIVKLREDIFQLKEKLDEEKTKTEVLKLIAENEKEKNDNFRAKFQTAKKLNGALINKLKERDISISKTLKNESNLLKKQVIEKDKKIDELKVEIKKLNNEIESFKREIQKNNNKEKEYIKENNALKENLNQKENIIKISNNKLSEINIKYNEEINKNKKLSLELKELNLKNQRLIDEKRKIPKSEKDLLLKMSTPTPIHYKTKKAKNNKSFDLKNEEDEKHGGSGGSNHGSIIEPKSSSKIFKLEKHYNDYDMIDENKIIKKYKKESNTIKEINEDNISISESSSEDNASPNEDKSEKKK